MQCVSLSIELKGKARVFSPPKRSSATDGVNRCRFETTEGLLDICSDSRTGTVFFLPLAAPPPILAFQASFSRER